MMRTPDVNAVIEQFDALPLEDKEVAVEIMRKAYAEAAREALAKRATKAVSNLKAGKVKKGRLGDLLNDLKG
jgi:hypothetical protein